MLETWEVEAAEWKDKFVEYLPHHKIQSLNGNSGSIGPFYYTSGCHVDVEGGGGGGAGCAARRATNHKMAKEAVSAPHWRDVSQARLDCQDRWLFWEKNRKKKKELTCPHVCVWSPDLLMYT